MDQLNFSDWVAIISALGMVLSIVVTISALVDKSGKRREREAEMRTDIKHIRENVDMTNATLNALDQKLDGIDTRVARVEESAKSAHRRIDGLENKLK